MVAQQVVADRDTSLSGIATVEYLGSKRRLLGQLVQAIVDRSGGLGEVVDLFAGTGIVAAGLKAAGFRVIANDHLAFCAHFARALLAFDREPEFAGLGHPSYEDVLARLNRLDGVKGFIYSNYSPASADQSRVERRYFTKENAGRVDAIREQIEVWRPSLTTDEYSLLLADLLRGVSMVSNVAGTYGCYLKQWKQRALEPLELEPSAFVMGSDVSHEVHQADAHDLLKRLSAPVIYADPPYTKRQYAAYYHILETIACDDDPAIEGSTGLRDWRSHASEFCYKRRAPEALRKLVEAADCKHFFLSYSEDGQITHKGILEILRPFGHVEVIDWEVSRYRSNNGAHQGATVTERLYHLSKEPQCP